MNLIPVLFMLMETVVMNVKRVLRLALHRNVSTVSLRRSAPLMLGLTTVLWPHVGRYYLEKEQNWTLKVNEFLYNGEIILSMCFIKSQVQSI